MLWDLMYPESDSAISLSIFYPTEGNTGIYEECMHKNVMETV